MSSVAKMRICTLTVLLAAAADRYLLQAEQAVRTGDASSARAAIERLVSLQREHGLELAPEDHYHTPFPLDIK